MIYEFTALDFETATSDRASICQVGLVQYSSGVIIKEFSMLIQPPKNEYSYHNVAVHGITAADTSNAPTFQEAWPELLPFFQYQHVVAHNGFAFDFQCLSKTLAFYQLQNPSYTGHCTYKIFKENLASLCRAYKIPLNHHDALSDAKACGELFLFHLNSL